MPNRKFLTILLLAIVLVLIGVFTLITLVTSNKAVTTSQNNTSEKLNPFNNLVDDKSNVNPSDSPVRTNPTTPNTASNDYMKMLGVDVNKEEPGQTTESNEVPDHAPKAAELGYIQARVVTWADPNIIQLYFENSADKKVEEYSVDCKGNTALISAKDNSVVETGFSFNSKLAQYSTVFIKCLDDSCSQLGDSCIVIR